MQFCFGMIVKNELGVSMQGQISDDKLNKLVAMDRHLNTNRDFVSKIEIISSTIKEIIQADRCTIFVHDAHTKSFWTAYVDGICYLELPEGKGIVGKVFESGEDMVVNQVEEKKEHYKKVDKVTEYQTKSMIAMPIKGFNGDCIGVVQILNKIDGDTFLEEDKQVLHFVLNHISSFVEYIALQNRK